MGGRWNQSQQSLHLRLLMRVVPQRKRSLRKKLARAPYLEGNGLKADQLFPHQDEQWWQR